MRRTKRGVAPALVIPAAVGLAFLVLPLVALVARAPWGSIVQIVAKHEVLTSLLLSLGTASVATVISLILGVPLAVLLSSSVHWPVVPRRLLRALITVPLVLPPVVGGVALLLLLGRRGIIGQWLYEWFQITVPFTPAAVILAQVFVAMPFLVLAVEGALRASDHRFELAAASLGASRWYVFRRVTIPLIGPGVSAGALLCFTRSLGEFGATITFAGSFPGTTQTLPVTTYLELQQNPDAAIALSLLLLAVAVAVLVSLRDRWLPGLTG